MACTKGDSGSPLFTMVKPCQTWLITKDQWVTIKVKPSLFQARSS